MIFEMILMSFILFVETKSNAVASELLRHKILNGTVHTYYGQMAFLVEVFLESASCGACLNWHKVRRSLPTVFAGFLAELSICRAQTALRLVQAEQL